MQNSHRQFLQVFMSSGMLTGREVKETYRKAVEQYGGTYVDGALVNFVKTINDNVKPFNLEIRKAIDEVTGVHSYVLVNKAETDITRLSSDYTNYELELFKKLVEVVVESEDGFISSTEALNLTDQLEKIKVTKTDAVKLFESLKRNKWLGEVNGAFYLTARSVAELEPYILERHEAAVKCCLCHKLCLHGQNCGACDVRLHIGCAARCFTSANVVCPNARCAKPWPHAVSDTQGKDGRSPQKSQSISDDRQSQRTKRSTKRS